MVQGSGIGATMVLLCMLGIFSQMAHGRTYVVGDHCGWTFNVSDWPNGKNFKAGDILVFNYNPKYHNVVLVDDFGYNSCVPPDGSRTYQSGHDRIQLFKGNSFFISTFSGDCKANTKIAVTV